MEWDPQQLEVEGIEGNAKLKISDENYSLAHLADGKLSFSWNGAFPDSDWLLKLKVKAIKAVRLSEGLHVSSTVTPALSVLKTTQEEGEVSLNFNGMMLHEFVVLPNEPNPWNTKTTIGLWMPDEGVVSFSVYDLYGKLYLKKNCNSERISGNSIRPVRFRSKGSLLLSIGLPQSKYHEKNDSQRIGANPSFE